MGKRISLDGKWKLAGSDHDQGDWSALSAAAGRGGDASDAGESSPAEQCEYDPAAHISLLKAEYDGPSPSRRFVCYLVTE